MTFRSALAFGTFVDKFAGVDIMAAYCRKGALPACRQSLAIMIVSFAAVFAGVTAVPNSAAASNYFFTITEFSSASANISTNIPGFDVFNGNVALTGFSPYYPGWGLNVSPQSLGWGAQTALTSLNI